MFPTILIELAHKIIGNAHCIMSNLFFCLLIDLAMEKWLLRTL